MPIISAYVGDSKIFGLFAKSSKEFEFFDFPYLYSSQLFSNHSDESTFYKAVFEVFCKKFKTTLAKCPIYLTGFAESSGFDQFNRISLSNVLSSFQVFYPVLINSYSIITRDILISEISKNFAIDDDSKQDIYANLSIYPHLTFFDNISRFHADGVLTAAALKNGLNMPADQKVLFMGSRFLDSISRPSDYLLMMSLFPKAGVYNLCLDKNNSMLLEASLKLVPTSNLVDDLDIPILEDSIEYIGTLVSTTGSIECLVKSEVGTAQLFDVAPNTLFTVPLPKDCKSRVVIKNGTLGMVEKELSGGTLGIIFDTREQKDTFSGSTNVFDSLVRTIEEASKTF